MSLLGAQDKSIETIVVVNKGIYFTISAAAEVQEQ